MNGGHYLQSITLPTGVELDSRVTLLCRKAVTYTGNGESDDAALHPGDAYEVQSVEWVHSDESVIVGLDEGAPLDYIDLVALEEHIKDGELAVVSLEEE